MSQSMTVLPVTTQVFHPGQDLSAFVIESLGPQGLQEGDVLAVTSKIVSLAENRLVKRSSTGKLELVRREADQFLGEVGYGCSLTIKEGLLLPSAGIDESNSEHDDYILYPQDPYQSTQALYQNLREHYHLQNLGIILTDSHTTPLRWGVTGVGLAYAGFKAVRNMIGEPDIFGRTLQMTKMNLLDGLAATAVLMMGEANERRPLAILRGAPVEFCERITPAEIKMPLERDLYYPILEKLLK